ncbi:winged helix-turn-helix transcriptional regulator [Candidatus Gottesmanbacteria bacterium]|nr:winged helix-turn-helix transcriptional regulator [Candidatus Gottesmanbacteria bacterium]
MSDDIGQSTDTSSAPPVSDVPLANTPDSTWPISTKMANDQLQEASPSGQSAKTPLANNDSASSPDLANQDATSSGQVTTSLDASSSPNLPNQSLPADSTSSISPQPASPVDGSPSSLQSPTDNLPSPISVPSPSVEPSQMQSRPSDSPSQDTTTSTPPDLATIKPVSPQSPQNTSLANDNSQKTEEIKPTSPPKSSFGDILAKENPPSSSNPSPPSTSSNPPKPSSFGNILRGYSSSSQLDQSLHDEPKINIEPVVPPKPSPAVTPQIPQPPQFPLSPNTSGLRQKANQKRLDKKQKNLDRIMLLIKETGTITNTDVQRLCRVSQSTATNYLTELEKKGMLKQKGIRGGAKYTL